jgi:predicted RNA-binding Zn-ribbon protein involved in translation (DUF1610 family)
MTMVRRINTTKAARKIPPCPECGSAEVVPIVHGIPSPVQDKAIKKGKALLANREEWEGMTEWYCKTCGSDWSGGWRRFKKTASLS